MTSLFKKRKNLNVKLRRAEDEDEENSENQSDQTASLNKNPTYVGKLNPQILGPTETYFGKKDKKKIKEKTEKKLNVLSFEDELEADDGIVFQEKKSSLSYKLRKEMKKERKEKKKEEKEKQKPLTGSRERLNRNSPSTISELADLGIKIVNGREAESIAIQPGDSDDEDCQAGPKFIPRSKPAEELNLQPWKAALQSGKIPDANLIHQIRKERQRARERDFIPIDDTIREEEPNNRLVREDDNDHSDDEGNRITFSVNLDEVDRKKRKEAFEAAQDEENDQEVEWELQQLKKAGAAAKITEDKLLDNGFNVMQPSYAANLAAAATLPSYGNESVDACWGMSAGGIHQFATGLEKPINYQAEGIIKRLKDSRNSLEEVLRRHRVEADNVIDELVAAKTSIANCNAEQQPQTEIFRFYQDMRGYVTDLRECLNEKYGEIKKMEEQVYLIFRQQTQKLTQRRRQDVKDQNNEYSPFAGKLAKGDEYRIRRAAEREGRRTRRRRERERKGKSDHHDGMSTDDEEAQSERQLMQIELDAITTESKKLFDDVVEDFAEIKRIMERFEDWKTIDCPAYLDAYVSYNLPKIFAPCIYLQLIMWNPLKKEDNSADIEKMTWFNILLLYGAHLDKQDDFSYFKLDPDRRLLSNIVEKVILPKLKDLVSCSWDPLSHVQSVRLVNLVRHYTTSYPSISTNSKFLKDLMLAIIAKIKDSIENDVFIPMFPKTVYESRTSGVSLFFQRQFWSAWKLLASVLMWHRILNDSVIHDLAIRSLLNLYLLPALNLAADINVKDALDKARNVINVLPREWSKVEGGTHAFLCRLELFLVTLAGKLEVPLHAAEINEICALLKAIGARAQAQVIMNKYL